MLLLLGKPTQADNLTLNLKGADIATLVETISEATGRNFILDPKVQGKITVISAHPMSEEELYQTFLSILEVHGYIAVPTGNVIKIVPDSQLKYSGALKDGKASVNLSGPDEVTIRVYTVKNIDTAKLIPVLRPLISPKGHLSAHTDSNTLVISDYAANSKRLEKIIRQIDKPVSSDIELVTLKHASAQELAQLINTLEKSSNPKNSKAAKHSIVVADERTNSLLIGGDMTIRIRLRTIIAHLDTPVESSGNTRVIHLRFAKAKDLAEVLTSMGQNYVKEKKGNGKDAVSPGIVNVQAYADANALVLTAPANLLKNMEGVIRKLDVRRAQVQVEAIIAEISSDLAAELGVEWGVLGGPTSANKGIVSGTNFAGSGPGLFSIGGSALNGDATSAASMASGLGGLILGGTDLDNFAVLLHAIKNDSNNNLLSTPTLITLDNEEAEIVVGKEVPFITGTFSKDNSTNNPFQTINRENVGLTLRVTPQINEGDTIRLDLVQEVSSLVPDSTDVSLADAVTRTRSIKTTVLVDNGHILILGGLIENEVQQSVSKVPLLGDLPFIGALFRAERTTNHKTNLMVFLRPTILRSKQDGLDLTHDKYNSIRNHQLAIPNDWNLIAPENTHPILPEISSIFKMSQKIQATNDVQRVEEKNTEKSPNLDTPVIEMENRDISNYDSPVIEMENRNISNYDRQVIEMKNRDIPNLDTPVIEMENRDIPNHDRPVIEIENSKTPTVPFEIEKSIIKVPEEIKTSPYEEDRDYAN